ncbi:MAG: MBL fold metallo-hydrolase, partial [Desulfatiglandales bacterium]
MSEQKDATKFTQQVNAKILENLPFDNKEDFELARRGFIGTLPNMVIRNETGNVVWDMEQYSFLAPDVMAPATVNPSLWRQAQLNTIYGLFKVTDRIYQVRGFDISNITFIEGDTGWIIIDTLISTETSKAALNLVYQHLSKKPIIAVIITHSHADHFGGVRGLVSKEDVEAGKVKIIAPDGFLKHAVSENVIAGNAMSRRATYMYGNLLAKGPKVQVGSGLGKTTSTGSVSLVAPTDTITKTGQEMIVDGIQITFQLTPGTEAPAEFNLYFPQFKTLCMAENVTATLHNLL